MREPMSSVRIANTDIFTSTSRAFGTRMFQMYHEASRLTRTTTCSTEYTFACVLYTGFVANACVQWPTTSHSWREWCSIAWSSAGSSSTSSMVILCGRTQMRRFWTSNGKCVRLMFTMLSVPR